MQSHSDHCQEITHARACIAENSSDTVVAFEPSIAVFNADPSEGSSGVGLFLLLGEFVFGFPFLFPLPFEWDDDLCITNGEADDQPLSART